MNEPNELDFPRYFGAQLHCHSSIEGPASIGAHCFEAKRAGVDVVWLTDHDTRIALCSGGPFIERFEFSAPELMTTVERLTPSGTAQRFVGWNVLRRDEGLARAALTLSREHAYAGEQSMCVAAAAGSENSANGAGQAAGAGKDTGEGSDADWQYYVVEFKADAKLHGRPLLAGATVGIAVRLETAPSADAEAWVDLVLSEQPPDLRQARLRYLLTPSAAAPDSGQDHPPEEAGRYRTYTRARLTPAHEWVRHQLRPAGDASGDGLGGADNALTGLRVGVRLRCGAHLRLYVGELTITHEYAGDALHARQRALARELGEQHGVVCHVAQEISMAGQHKNAWGSRLPLLDYAARPSGFTHEHAIAWVRQHCVPFSLNHPFSKYNRVEMDDAARERALTQLIETYTATRASGANSLEVGFPAGRHGFDLDHYLRLWDALVAQGIYILGTGSSDAHSARVGWQNGNNFATYIRADTPDEDSLLAGLRCGDVYVADPVRFRSRLSFSDRAGHHMGQVVALDGNQEPGAQEVVLALDRARPRWELCWVVDGVRHSPIPLPEGTSQHRLRLDTSRSTFVRAEIWDRSVDASGIEAARSNGSVTGRCIALTNPICYHRGPRPEDVPAERLVA
ncbi:MAG: hypothetical protein HY332_12670 [Chloroflexi bacterium]|nr:hypothetical protein [Chloroflexota bacterium]